MNPARARDFARAAGFLAKTDRIDARMLAAMARSLDLAPDPVSCPRRRRLTLLMKRRDQLVLARKQEKALKLEIRRLEGGSNQSDVNMEYLKNIVVSDAPLDSMLLGGPHLTIRMCHTPLTLQLEYL